MLGRGDAHPTGAGPPHTTECDQARRQDHRVLAQSEQHQAWVESGGERRPPGSSRDLRHEHPRGRRGGIKGRAP